MTSVPSSPLIYSSIFFESGEAERRLAAKQPKSNKELRKAQVDIASAMTSEFVTAIRALLTRNGTKIQDPLERAVLKECAWPYVLSLYDAEKYNLKNSGKYTVVGAAETKLLFAKATLSDGSIIDPCVVYPTETDLEKTVSHYRYFVAGGSVKKLERSPFTLPFPIIERAANTLEYRMGSYNPLLVSIRGEMKYLVEARSIFFSCGELKGCDVDQNQASDAVLDEFRKGNHVLGDTLRGNITIVLGEIAGVNELRQVNPAPGGLLRQIIRMVKG